MSTGIYKHKPCLEETKRKISEANKGQIPWIVGKYHTEETKAKISKTRLKRKEELGYLNSPETREKISKAQKGKKLSEETKRKMSESRKGRKHSKETKRKISQAHIGMELSKEHRRALSKSHLGKHYSPGTEFKKGHKMKLTKELIKKRLKRRIPTSLEEKFQEIVNKHNLPYKFVGNGSFFIEHYNPDFINTNSEKIAIEVYARFYKQLDGRNIEDWKQKRTETFKKYGWEIMYFDEVQVKEEYILSVLGK